MKKKLVAFLLVVTMIALMVTPAFAADIRTVWTDITYRGIGIVVNGIKIVPCDEQGNPTEPFIMNDTTYLPVRAIANALGLKVGWESSTSTVVLERGGEEYYGSGVVASTRKTISVSITYRGTKISLDGENVPLVNRNGESVEPFIYNGTNYLPLRVVSEALGLNVDWDGSNSIVTIKGTMNSGKEEEKEDVPIVNGVLRLKETKFYEGYTGFSSSFEEYMNVKYSYDSQGRLTRVQTGDGSRSLVCTYDAAGRLSTATLNGRYDSDLYNFVYDDEGNLMAYYVNGEIREGRIAVYDEAGRVIKEEKPTESGEPGKFEYTYDEQGRLATSINRNKWNGMDYIGYKYDSEGRVIVREEYHGSLDGPREDAITKYLFTYDENGNLIKEESCATGSDSVVHTKDYTYDADGKLIFTTEFNSSGGGQNYSTGDRYENSYTYDENGNLIYRLHKYYDAYMEGARPAYEYKLNSECEYWYEYDAAGNMTYEKTDDTEYRWGGSHSGTEKSWSYDDEGRIIEKSNREYGDNKSDIKRVEKYAYDSEGRVIERRESSYFNGNFEGEHRYVYAFDENGNETEYYNYNTEDRLVYSCISEYDEQGRFIKAVVKENNYLFSTETVEYDENGLLLRTEYASASDGISKLTENEYALVENVEQAPFIEELLTKFKNSLP